MWKPDFTQLKVLAVLEKQQQLADNTCQLPEETQTDVAVDLYVTIEEVNQDTPITSAIDSLT